MCKGWYPSPDLCIGTFFLLLAIGLGGSLAIYLFRWALSHQFGVSP